MKVVGGIAAELARLSCAEPRLKGYANPYKWGKGIVRRRWAAPGLAATIQGKDAARNTLLKRHFTYVSSWSLLPSLQADISGLKKSLQWL